MNRASVYLELRRPHGGAALRGIIEFRLADALPSGGED
jgi:hypothetical protein